MKTIFFLFIIANFCEKGTYGNFSFERIPVGRYGSSLQKCGKNTLNGMCFSKHLLCLGIWITLLAHTYHPSN